jgi:hypothetical protein
MTDGTQNAPDVTPDLRLRPERPPVTRLSRKVLIRLGGVSGFAIAAALVYALQPRIADQDSKELYSTENRATADGLTGLPRDYTGIPKLGSPLPRDLGRPILSAQNHGQPIAPGGVLPQPGITPEEQRRLQEIEAARLSKLFAATAIRTPLPAPVAASAAPGTTLAVPAEALPLDPNAMQNMQILRMLQATDLGQGEDLKIIDSASGQAFTMVDPPDQKTADIVEATIHIGELRRERANRSQSRAQQPLRVGSR